jgi:hypothetical protein
MKQEHHVLIRKRQLEIVTIVFTVLVLLALLIAVIVLSTQLHKCRNAPTPTSVQCDCEKDCLACAEQKDSSGTTVGKVCCRQDQGGPIIKPSGDRYISCCAKECP